MFNRKAIVLLILVVSVIVVGVYATDGEPIAAIWGQRYQEAVDNSVEENDTVLAVYKDQDILQSVVDYQIDAGVMDVSTSVDTTNASQERKAIDNIIVNLIMNEEAEQRGLTATEEEIEEFIDSTVYTSYKIPEGKEIIDTYCENAGLTFEEYVANVREQAPNIIARFKLQEEVKKEYCVTHGIQYDRLNTPPEVKGALREYKENLLEMHREDITYKVNQ